MDYETAKKLKDAGFPFDWNMKCTLCLEEGHGGCPEPLPTLSELIEACGEQFSALERFDGNFHAYFENEHDIHWSGVGPTREIAAANLWLALHGAN